MHRYWETVVQPLLDALHPSYIAEIGCGRGENTRHLVEYARRTGAKVHAVDPAPAFDVVELEREYGESLTFHRCLSLNALPAVQQADAVLIDGDHNWYTVYHELKLIERHAMKSSRPFPLVLLHDVGWPYARRDMYYNPETIPVAYRQPYKRMGVRLGEPELQDRDGFNAHINHSIYENSLNNGVLTAVEDFMAEESQQDLVFVRIPGVSGLGVLVRRELLETNRELAQQVERIRLTPFGELHAETMEGLRLELERQLQNYKLALRSAKSALQLAEERLLAATEELTATRTHLTDLDGEQKDALAKAHRRISELNQQVEAERKLRGAHSRDAASRESEIQALRAEVTRLSKELQQVVPWLEQLSTGATALIESRRWKLGRALGDAVQTLALKPRRDTAAEYMVKVMRRFQGWKERRPKLTASLPVGGCKPPGVAPARKPALAPVPGRNEPSVAIVICVHNALEDVKACLTSLLKNTPRNFQLILVNDGSEEPTTLFLREYVAQHAGVILIENAPARGYTIAANQGLKACDVDYAVLLNSDTILPPLWLERLIECGEGNPAVGIFGPLSNAASWQSVPEVFSGAGDWSLNPLPQGITVDRMAELVAASSGKKFPRVPIVNGFCFVIKRKVIDAIGYLDEETFPRGYGEENDYCLRAAQHGFELAVADHCYVFHAKSKSFTHERRKTLSKNAGHLLRQKHGNKVLEEATGTLRRHPILAELREKVEQALESARYASPGPVSGSAKVMFLLPVRGGGGGAHSVVQEAAGMHKLGTQVALAVPHRYRENYQTNYPSLINDNGFFFFYKNEDELIAYAAQFDVAVATIYHSVETVSKIVAAHPTVVAAYYVQDYEPWFFDEDSREWARAFNSYTMVPSIIPFAKTHWIRDIVSERHGVEVHKVPPSLDASVYYPDFSRRHEDQVVVTAMVRPSTPRRGPERTMRLLHQLHNEFGSRVEIRLFGCTNEDEGFRQLQRSFPFINHGVLIREEVAELLRLSDCFLDLSDYQAFGRTGLEAMACGCAPVLPVKGGAHEYATHGENALLVDTASDAECYSAMRELVADDVLRQKLQVNGVQKATEYSIHRTVIAELALFQRWVSDRKRRSPRISMSRQLQVLALIPRPVVTSWPSSAHVRVLRPLQHPSIAGNIRLLPVTADNFAGCHGDVMLIQRTAVTDRELAQRLVEDARGKGMKVVFELDDDLLNTPQTHPEHAKYAEWRPALEVIARQADLITVSSDALASECRKYNPRVRLLQNALDETLWFAPLDSQPSPTPTDGQIRIVYMGTRTHGRDLALVAPAMKHIMDEFAGQVTFDVVGALQDSAGQHWFRLLDLPNYIEQYPVFVQWLRRQKRWDIGIAPLESGTFQQCKSYLKYLDYSALGMTSVCSATSEYRHVVRHGVNGLLVDDSEEAWYQALKQLIGDVRLRGDLGRQAAETVRQGHLLKTRAKDWLETYMELANAK